MQIEVVSCKSITQQSSGGFKINTTVDHVYSGMKFISYVLQHLSIHNLSVVD